MDREIIFRGKKSGTEEWVFGSLQIYLDNVCYILNNNQWDKKTLVQPESIGQYTGLNDKNGNKIFEGDILEYGWMDRKNTLVDFDKGMFRHKTNALIIGHDEMTIVGNIHDNPELLPKN